MDGEVSRETVMRDENRLEGVADWLSLKWNDQQREQFDRFEKWLAEEAIVAGGIGPGERQRLWDRHIVDSLVFLRCMSSTALSLVDVGSGVGLPAIPIAIARPDLEVTIVDRAEGRTRLASRACRILKLDNVEVRNVDAGELSETYDVLTFRAALPLDAAAKLFLRIASLDGEGWIALSRTSEPKSPLVAPEGVTVAMRCEDDEVLETPAWLLGMRRRDSRLEDQADDSDGSGHS